MFTFDFKPNQIMKSSMETFGQEMDRINALSALYLNSGAVILQSKNISRGLANGLGERRITALKENKIRIPTHQIRQPRNCRKMSEYHQIVAKIRVFVE